MLSTTFWAHQLLATLILSNNFNKYLGVVWFNFTFRIPIMFYSSNFPYFIALAKQD